MLTKLFAGASGHRTANALMDEVFCFAKSQYYLVGFKMAVSHVLTTSKPTPPVDSYVLKNLILLGSSKERSRVKTKSFTSSLVVDSSFMTLDRMFSKKDYSIRTKKQVWKTIFMN